MNCRNLIPIDRLEEVQEKNKRLGRIYNHIDKVKVSATFSNCGKYRYRLEIFLAGAESGGEAVCAILQNPSVADCFKADKSVQFLEKLIFSKGYPEFSKVKKLIVVNLFAFVQTNKFSGGEELVGEKNDDFIKKAIDESDIILIAWGKNEKYGQRKTRVCEMIKNKKVFLGKKHPSRASYKDYFSICTL